METSPLGLQGLFVIEPDPAQGIAWPCGDRPAWVFPVDRQWPALAALDSPFHPQETRP